MFGKFRGLLSHFKSDDSGVTAIEYGMIAAAIAIVIIVAAELTGTNLTDAFNAIATAVDPH